MRDEQKVIYGLIGYPVGHSLSPLMHNTAFRELKVDAEYRLFPLKEEELKGFFEDLKRKDSPIFGLNVTIPYKEKVLKFLDTVSPFAEKVQAVNTIVISKKRWLTGYNTDGPGFLTHLTEMAVHPEGKRISILGAGGAARAIVSVLCILPERPVSIRIFDIDKKKTTGLLNDLGQRMNVSIVQKAESIDDLNIELADILINTTPVGMKNEDPCLISPDILHSRLFVYDVIYNPSETKLLQLAKSKKAKTANGLGMLFYQGVLAFQHWADVQLPEPIKKKMRTSLVKGLSDQQKGC